MSDDVTIDLIGALIENMMRAGEGWESFAMVVSLEDDRIVSVSGYTYDPDGTITAVAARPVDVEDAVRAYCASLYQPGEPLPKQMLVQFNRGSRQFDVRFEDDDASRWKATPANIATIREELRPPF